MLVLHRLVLLSALAQRLVQSLPLPFTVRVEEDPPQVCSVTLAQWQQSSGEEVDRLTSCIPLMQYVESMSAISAADATSIFDLADTVAPTLNYTDQLGQGRANSDRVSASNVDNPIQLRRRGMFGMGLKVMKVAIKGVAQSGALSAATGLMKKFSKVRRGLDDEEGDRVIVARSLQATYVSAFSAEKRSPNFAFKGNNNLKFNLKPTKTLKKPVQKVPAKKPPGGLGGTANKWPSAKEVTGLKSKEPPKTVPVGTGGAAKKWPSSKEVIGLKTKESKEPAKTGEGGAGVTKKPGLGTKVLDVAAKVGTIGFATSVVQQAGEAAYGAVKPKKKEGEALEVEGEWLAKRSPGRFGGLLKLAKKILPGKKAGSKVMGAAGAIGTLGMAGSFAAEAGGAASNMLKKKPKEAPVARSLQLNEEGEGEELVRRGTAKVWNTAGAAVTVLMLANMGQQALGGVKSMLTKPRRVVEHSNESRSVWTDDDNGRVALVKRDAGLGGRLPTHAPAARTKPTAREAAATASPPATATEAAKQGGGGGIMGKAGTFLTLAFAASGVQEYAPGMYREVKRLGKKALRFAGVVQPKKKPPPTATPSTLVSRDVAVEYPLLVNRQSPNMLDSRTDLAQRRSLSGIGNSIKSALPAPVAKHVSLGTANKLVTVTMLASMLDPVINFGVKHGKKLLGPNHRPRPTPPRFQPPQRRSLGQQTTFAVLGQRAVGEVVFRCADLRPLEAPLDVTLLEKRFNAGRFLKSAGKTTLSMAKMFLRR